MLRAPHLLALALLVPAAHAGVQGVEILGFGAEGPSASYASERFVPLRFRVLSDGGPADPVNVVLRRDDGATTVVANVTALDTVHHVDVPLKDESWTLNEFEAFAFEPAAGALHQGPATRSIIRVGGEGHLAAALETSRARVQPAGPPRMLEQLPPAPAEESEPEGFEAPLIAGADLDLLPGAL